MVRPSPQVQPGNGNLIFSACIKNAGGDDPAQEPTPSDGSSHGADDEDYDLDSKTASDGSIVC